MNEVEDRIEVHNNFNYIFFGFGLDMAPDGWKFGIQFIFMFTYVKFNFIKQDAE